MNDTQDEQRVVCPRCGNRMTPEPSGLICWPCDADDGAAAAGLGAQGRDFGATRSQDTNDKLTRGGEDAQ